MVEEVKLLIFSPSSDPARGCRVACNNINGVLPFLLIKFYYHARPTSGKHRRADDDDLQVYARLIQIFNEAGELPPSNLRPPCPKSLGGKGKSSTIPTLANVLIR